MTKFSREKVLLLHQLIAQETGDEVRSSPRLGPQAHCLKTITRFYGGGRCLFGNCDIIIGEGGNREDEHYD